MKLRKAFLLGVSMMVMAATATSAGEAATEVPEEQEESLGGLLTALFGEGGLLEEALPEGTDIDAMIDTASEQLEQADKEVSEVIDGVNNVIQNEMSDIDVDTEKIKEYGNLILDLISGEDDMDFSYLDELFEKGEKINAEEETYIMEHNDGQMDFGDVQIVSNNNIYRDDPDQEEIKAMCLMIQCNYKMDEENQLWFLSGASDIVLFTHQADENGDFPILNAVFAEDGEGYTDSVQAMCDEVGITLDECMESIEIGNVMSIYDLITYLDEHPEVKGIEYDGEIRTAEELRDIWGDELAKLEPETEE